MDKQEDILVTIFSNLKGASLENASIDMDCESVFTDSIAFIRVIVALERKYNFEFDDSMLLITKFPVIGSMVEYVQSKIS
jgi:acyl carrier protein